LRNRVHHREMKKSMYMGGFPLREKVCKRGHETRGNNLMLEREPYKADGEAWRELYTGASGAVSGGKHSKKVQRVQIVLRKTTKLEYGI